MVANCSGSSHRVLINAVGSAAEMASSHLQPDTGLGVDSDTVAHCVLQIESSLLGTVRQRLSMIEEL